jgi:hypothetical protein
VNISTLLLSQEELYIDVKVKVKLSCYRPGGALGVLGG